MNNKTLSTEELIKVLFEEEKSSTTSTDNNNLKVRLFDSDNFLYFIDFYNIKSGPDMISIMDIYNLYKHWSKNTNINIAQFKQITYQHLDTTDLNNKKKGYYISIDLAALQLSEKAKDILLNNYEKNPRFKSKLHAEEIRTFLNDMGIVSGKYAIPLTTLYFLFRYWSDKNISISMFEEYMKYHITYVKQYRKNKDTIFFIEKESLRIDEDIFEKAKVFTEKNKKENIKKKYKEISKTKKKKI